MTGLHRKLGRDYKTLGAQVFTIALLIVGGVSVLVSSWSSYQSLEKAKNSYYQEYQFADVFAEIVRAPEMEAQKIAAIEGVERVETRLIEFGLVDVPNQAEPALGRLISWAGPGQIINRIYIRRGRLPQKSSRVEVVIHESFAEAHTLRPGDPLQVTLNGQKRDLIISGIGLSPEYVYALSPLAPLPDDRHFGVLWMRREDMEAMTAMAGAFNSVQVKVRASASIAEIKRQMDRVLEPFGSQLAYDRSRQMSDVFVQDEIRQQRVMAFVLPSIFMAVAMFILNVILSRLIALHRGQIATLKSLGYSGLDLTFHYFQLVTLILLTGIGPALLAGAGIGHWYAGLYKEFFRFPVIDFSLSLSSIGWGVIAGLVPGWVGAAAALAQVARLRPAEALRPPSPPNFQRGLFEKFAWARKLDIFSKMVLRSLLFRPARLALSILGMSAAVAILITGSFWSDVVDFIIHRQFQEMRREDLTVSLLHPRDLSVYREMKRLPGVIMVEGSRAVPVRLQFRNFKKEISLLGWEPSAEMSRVLDQKGRVIRPVPGGVLLSRYFQIQYGLRPGEDLEFRWLEGSQKEFRAPLAGFVDDLVGQQAYALKSDLHRWLGEAPVVDTVYVKIDPRLAEKAYVALKDRPEVTSVSVKELLLRSFSRTVGDMVLTFTFILYAFAVAIAGAVMYNTARIGFSERGWELASLRIMGFAVRPAFEILFLDIGLQVICALIPGLLVGYGLASLSTNLIHNETFKFPLVIDLSTYGAAVLVIVLTYLASGFLLYYRVAKLDFSEALKARD